MKKDMKRAALVALIIVALYHMVVFMIPFAHETVFWLSYGFTLVAFIVAGVAGYMGFLKATDAKGRFYSFPIARIGLNYGAVQAVAGIVMMALGQWVVWWIPTLLYAIYLGWTVIRLVGAEATVDQIQTMDGQLKARVSRMRAIQSKVIHMEAQCADADAAKAVKALAEELRFSDPVSSSAVAEAENELVAVIDALQDAVADGEASVIVKLCAKATALLAERNRLCKLNK